MTRWGRRPRAWRRAGERGSLAVEMAFIGPSILLIFALIYAYGRAGGINGTLESGTRDAARMATKARNYDEAKQVALQVAHDAIVDTPQDCQDSLQVEVSDNFVPGETLTVQAQCTYSLSDIGLGVNAPITPKSSFSSPLDLYRGVDR